MSRFEEGDEVAGRYAIRDRLGIGGFAEVYRAFDSRIDRQVALKIMLTADLTDDEELRQNYLTRFRNEATLAARVDHPNVVQIFDIGEIEGTGEPFIVMEYLDGRDLDVHLRKYGPLAPARMLRLFSEAVLALAMAHQRGIVHKDIKPSNLFLTRPDSRFERLKILDFGIAHLEHALQGRITREGQVVGTPCYLAPEYATERIVTPALDVYQMGLIIAEMVTGRVVVERDDPIATMFAHVRGDLDLSDDLMASDLGPVLSRALALDHEDRFATAMEFHDALANVDPATIPDCSDSDGAPCDSSLSGSVVQGRLAERAPAPDTGNHRMNSTGERNSTRLMYSDSGEFSSDVRALPPRPAARAEPQAAPDRVAVRERVEAREQVDEREKEARDQVAQVKSARAQPNLNRTEAMQALSVAAARDTERSGIPTWVTGTLIGAVVLAGLVIAIWPSDDSPEEIGNPDPSPVVVDRRSPQPSIQPEPDDQEAGLQGAEAIIFVTIASDPAGATVSENGRELGETPLEVDFFSVDERPRSFGLELSGHRAATRRVGPNDAPEVSVELQVIADKKKPAAYKAPAKPEILLP